MKFYQKVGFLFAVFFSLAGCSTMDMGKGGSVVTGSSGNGGAQGESSALNKCSAGSYKPTIVVDEADNEQARSTGARYAIYASRIGLPQDPKPLVKLMLQQTGCFRVVNRAAGLRSAKAEQELKEDGFMREGSTVKKGRVMEAQYTLIPQVIFTENNAGGGGGMAAAFGNAFLPGVGTLLAGSLKFREAQVMVTFVNNETLEEEITAEGSAKATDIGMGAALFGGLGAAGGGGFSNTNEGKVVAAALMNAINKIVAHVQTLNVPNTPEAPRAVSQPRSERHNDDDVRPANAPTKAQKQAKKRT